MMGLRTEKHPRGHRHWEGGWCVGGDDGGAGKLAGAWRGEREVLLAGCGYFDVCGMFRVLQLRWVDAR
jgi:hypothetical protein